MTFAASSKNIDVIIGGHNDTIAHPQIVLRNSEKNQVIIANAAQGGSIFGNLNFGFNEQRQMHSFSCKNFIPGATGAIVFLCRVSKACRVTKKEIFNSQYSILNSNTQYSITCCAIKIDHRKSPSTKHYKTKEFVVIGDIVFSNCCNPQSNIRNPKRYPIIGIPDLLSHRSGMTVKKCFVAMKNLRPSWTVIPDPIGNPRLRSTYLYNEENFCNRDKKCLCRKLAIGRHPDRSESRTSTT
jgi:hypothetical protein